MRSAVAVIFAAIALVAAACGSAPGDPRGDAGSGDEPVLTISAIPDQDPQELQRRYETVSNYLSEHLDVPVRYVPVTDYTASVTAFKRGDLQLVFFGGLTGVQARAQVPGSVPIAQRDIDAEFRSVFIASTATELEPFGDVGGLRSLAGHSFTFGSDTSTSGRLMPQHFLSQAGLALDELSGEAGFSGSHDATAKLVEAGTYQAGALNAAVWDDRVNSGKIDTGKVREIFRTPPYHDYHWLARPDLDDRFGDGFTQRIADTLLSIDGSGNAEREILALFQANKFIATDPGNYAQIESVARSLGLLR
ncbi:MAG: putative selenate ABC transporter substrate-binding protein [Pseudonocardiaceae bacterium]